MKHPLEEHSSEIKRVIPEAEMQVGHVGLITPEPAVTPTPRSTRAHEPFLDGERVLPTPQPVHAEAQIWYANRNQSPQHAQSNQAAVHIGITPQTRVAANTAVPRHEAAIHIDTQVRTVHVTIGRVEVRAITPQVVPVQRLPEKKASTNQSLAEYLQERNRGRR